MKLPVLLATVIGTAIASRAESNIVPGNQLSWAPNIGWLDWRPTTQDGVQISEYFCSGYLYSGNVGWISLGNGSPTNGVYYQNNSASDYGVNVDSIGNLRGYAYGANIGWVNFEAAGNPHVDLTTGKLSGYAYGANIGWITLGDSNQFVAINSIASGPDTDGDGIPDAWELSHVGNLTTMSQTSDTDGDGITDIEEYRADTDPLDPTDGLRVRLQTIQGSAAFQMIWTVRPYHTYQLQSLPALGGATQWINVGNPLESGTATELSQVVNNSSAEQYFRIVAKRSLAPN